LILGITTRGVNRLLVAIFFLLLATVPNFFTIDGKNLLLIGYAVFGIVALTLINFRAFPVLQNHFILFVFAYLVLSGVLNHEEAQLSSIVYSFFFIATYIFYSGFAKENFDVGYFRKVLRLIFILYFIGLIAGKLYVSYGLFTPIGGIPGFLKGHLGTTLESSGFRYYSLSSEPSYASFIVILLYYSYVLLGEKKGSLFRGENLFLFIMLTYMIFYFKSGYGIVLFGILLLNYIGFSKTSIIFYAIGFILAILFLIFGAELFAASDFVPLQRVLNVLNKFNFSNPTSLIQADFNTYFRIAPIFHYFQTSSVIDWQFYFGHGASTSKEFIVPTLFTAYLEGEYLGGFIPAFFYDYGLFGACLVIVFIARLLPGFFSISTVIVILLLTNANFNTQLFWFVILCLSMNKYFLQLKQNDEVIY
jgi:hypothetical protein